MISTITAANGLPKQFEGTARATGKSIPAPSADDRASLTLTRGDNESIPKVGRKAEAGGSPESRGSIQGGASPTPVDTEC